MLNAHNTVFGSKRSVICATVEMSCDVFFKLNALHVSPSVPATRKTCRGIVAKTVANVMAASLPITHNACAVHDRSSFPLFY